MSHTHTHRTSCVTSTQQIPGAAPVLLLSSIVNVPGEWTLRREFLRLQTQDGDEGGHGGGGAQQRQQVGFYPSLVWWDHFNHCTQSSPPVPPVRKLLVVERSFWTLDCITLTIESFRVPYSPHYKAHRLL